MQGTDFLPHGEAGGLQLPQQGRFAMRAAVPLCLGHPSMRQVPCGPYVCSGRGCPERDFAGGVYDCAPDRDPVTAPWPRAVADTQDGGEQGHDVSRGEPADSVEEAYWESERGLEEAMDDGATDEDLEGATWL